LGEILHPQRVGRAFAELGMGLTVSGVGERRLRHAADFIMD
jgi:hypothetical protein